MWQVYLKVFEFTVDSKTFKYTRFSFELHVARDLQWSLSKVSSPQVARSVASILATLRASGLETFDEVDFSFSYSRLETCNWSHSYTCHCCSSKCGKYTCVFSSCGLETFDGHFSFSPLLNSECGKYTCHTSSSTVDSRLSMRRIQVSSHVLLGRVASILESFRFLWNSKTFKYTCFSFELHVARDFR